MKDRVDRLRAHVAAIADAPCIWGKDDCTAWAAAWVEKERGISLGLPAYTEAEGRALIAQPGALLRLWSEKLEAAGILETDHPVRGDVLIIETRQFGHVGAIMCADGLCTWRAERGATFLRPRIIVKAWAI